MMPGGTKEKFEHSILSTIIILPENTNNDPHEGHC